MTRRRSWSHPKIGVRGEASDVPSREAVEAVDLGRSKNCCWMRKMLRWGGDTNAVAAEAAERTKLLPKTRMGALVESAVDVSGWTEGRGHSIVWIKRDSWRAAWPPELEHLECLIQS